MELLLLVLARGLVIALYIYVRDKYEREPFKAAMASMGFATLETGSKASPLLQGLVYATTAHGLFDFGAIRESGKASGAFWAGQESAPLR